MDTLRKELSVDDPCITRVSVITFEEADHRYKILDTYADYSASTYYTLQLFDKFDRIKVATNCARSVKTLDSAKDRLDYILGTWNFAAYMGTLVHRSIERILLSKEEDYSELDLDVTKYTCAAMESKATKELLQTHSIDKLKDAVAKRVDQFQAVRSMFLNMYSLFASEYMIWGRIGKDLIAGTVDAIFWVDKDERSVILMDWKTNKNLQLYPAKVTNESSPFYEKKISKLDQYFCQLHIYGRILEKYYQLNVVDSFIVHLEDEKYNIHRAPAINECACCKFYDSLDDAANQKSA